MTCHPVARMAAILSFALVLPVKGLDYTIVDTHQDSCYDTLHVIPAPAPGQQFYGQDAQFSGNQPSYQDNGNGTVTDLKTSLMWVQERGVMTSIDSAISGAAGCRIGGYSDWRMPTIKELYSLIDFRGFCRNTDTNSTPYIDTTFFEFRYGDTTIGRLIDCQDWSGTRYVGLTMVADTTYFGVNFADGRIKGYGTIFPPGSGQKKQLYHRYVRGNPSYTNALVDNGDSTVTDSSTGLMWTKFDSRAGMNWKGALAWVEAKNTTGYCGHNDWRLPNAKELQSIVDYTRAPAAINPSQRGPAIDTSVFAITTITNERGDADYPWFWTGTTHLDGPQGSQYTAAVYVTFGRASGWMMLPGNSFYSFLDVHGAGAQRSDPKRGSPRDFCLGLDSLGDSVFGRGPQGDCIHIENYVRLARDAGAGVEQGHGALPSRDRLAATVLPNPFHTRTTISLQLTANSPARIAVCDASGRLVRSFAIHHSPLANRYSIVWDGADACGRPVSPGVYFCRLDCAGIVAEVKLLKLDHW
jgi:hypothetical protein